MEPGPHWWREIWLLPNVRKLMSEGHVLPVSAEQGWVFPTY